MQRGFFGGGVRLRTLALPADGSDSGPKVWENQYCDNAIHCGDSFSDEEIYIFNKCVNGLVGKGRMSNARPGRVRKSHWG